MKNSCTFIFIILCVASSCNSNKTCKYEQEYNQVADSLRVLLRNGNKNTFDNEKLTQDFAKLSCADFQEKYKLNDFNLKFAIKSVRTSISLLEVFKAIEENIKLSEESVYQRSDSYKEGGLTKEEMNERDSLMKIFTNGTPIQKAKAQKELEKFPAEEYSFNKKPVLIERDGETEAEVLKAAFDSKITPSPSPQ